jgi:hypothetical protein
MRDPLINESLERERMEKEMAQNEHLSNFIGSYPAPVRAPPQVVNKDV